ncbi:MAG: endonuclease/exonuclease/phosphatase family protein [Actinomycetota bacterium]|nr:endonuclease/exonuclease/phosphatase family protein [Actinomycetota bacterium]
MSRWAPKTLEVLGWTALLPMLGLCVTQWFGIEGRRTIAAFQALTPWVLVWAAPIALAASLTRRHPLAIASLAPLITLLALSAPVVFHGSAPAAAAGSPRLTIAYANALYSNPTPERAAAELLSSDADVLVIVELSNPMRQSMEALVAEGDYPFRDQTPFGGAGGIGIWSRREIVSGGIVAVDGRPTVDVVLDVDGSEMRVLGVHPYPPTFNAHSWSQQLAAIGDTFAASTLPTVVVGDFNGSRWHPSFRNLLGHGLRDTHEVLGLGWSVSWPMDEGLLPPTFVRIDHALFGTGVTPTSIRDVVISGSDHKGFVVTFAFTTSAAVSSGE